MSLTDNDRRLEYRLARSCDLGDFARACVGLVSIAGAEPLYSIDRDDYLKRRSAESRDTSLSP